MGTAGNPGRNVKARAGLNREILATGRANLRRMLEYKAHRVITGDPRHTSRTCAACGHVKARPRIRVSGLRPRGSHGPERGPHHSVSGTGAPAG